MGIQIGCYSPWHGRGNTVTAIIFAINLAINYDAKVLLMHSQYKRSTLEEAFPKGNEDLLSFSDSGIDSLERYAMAGELRDSDFESYCTNKIPNRLDLLLGSKKVNRTLFTESMERTILKVLEAANKAYDFVVIDVNSGTNINDNVTKKVLQSSDLVLATLDQTEMVIEEFFTNDIKNIPNENIKVILGKYDPISKCSKNYVKNTFNYPKEIYTIPYLTNLLDSINNRDVLKFFYGNNNSIRNDDIKLFFNELNMLTDDVINDLNVKIDKFPYRSNNLFTVLKRVFKVG